MILSVLKSQVASKVDTLFSKEGQLTYSLSKKPLILSSAQVIINGRWVPDADVDEIHGAIKLGQPIPDSTVIYVSYQYLANPVPLRVGPLWKEFPSLDSILIDRKMDRKASMLKQGYPDPYQNIVSTGTVYRHIQVSPFGGTNFGGGMQINLQGNLSRDIHVSGVLTDQQTGLQPEGNTRELDEFDRIYLKVDHANFTLTAGDIDYRHSVDRFLDIDRKLTGLKQSFDFTSMKGSAVFGGSNGIFHSVDFDGKDGNQGPYQLRSTSGNSDIIVLSGTEKVYLDGKLLTRGENHDYTIDYSLGEILFTPKNQIEFDSNIHVDYQYSDFQYSRNLAGGEISQKIFSGSKLSLGWYREFDQVGDENTRFSSDIIDSLNKAGDRPVTISTAEADSNGRYILSDGIYVFTTGEVSGKPYNVIFQNDPVNGEYVRNVTNRGILFYEYIEKDQRTPLTELYSPVRKLIAPASKDLIYLDGDFNLTPGINMDVAFKTSKYDRNTMSAREDNDNLGYEYTVRMEGKGTPLNEAFLMGMDIEYWSRTETYSSLGRLREVEFLQDWDLVDQIIGAESRFRSSLSLKYGDILNLQSGFSSYKFGPESRIRFTNNISFSKGLVHDLTVRQNRVSGSDQIFSQGYTKIVLLRGDIHPYLEAEDESSSDHHRFLMLKSGLTASINQFKGSISIGTRDDELFSPGAGKMEKSGESLFGALELAANTRTYKQEFEFRKRIKKLPLENTALDYELMRLKINYNTPKNLVRLDLNSRLEESLTEIRAVVYDSIGRGYGQYRYDPIFNEYIEDPNGPFRSYTVFSGDKRPSTIFMNSVRTRFDFSRIMKGNLKGLIIDNTVKSEYRGRNFEPGNILNYTIKDDLLRAAFRYTVDIVYRQPGSARRLSLGSDWNRDLNGLDPRGNSQTKRNDVSGEYNEPLNRNLLAIVKTEIHSGERKSNVLSSRDRNYRGWNYETGFKFSRSGLLRFSGFLQGGRDYGSSAGEDFAVRYYGVRTELLRFIGKRGRVELIGDWNLGSGNIKYYNLPPEVMNSLTIGENIKVQIRGQYLIGDYFSLNGNLSFIDNARYNRFMAISGEFRAYF